MENSFNVYRGKPCWPMSTSKLATRDGYTHPVRTKRCYDSCTPLSCEFEGLTQ